MPVIISFASLMAAAYMVSKDQVLGALILVACLVIAVGYLAILLSPQPIA
ncbi:MAG: hypothetical protein QXM00_12160 [Candidatus Bathyarchaeia archaeon]